jgi:hypothetical protein
METSFIIVLIPCMAWMLVKALFLQDMPTLGSFSLEQAVLDSQFFFVPMMAALVYVSGIQRILSFDAMHYSQMRAAEASCCPFV